VFFYSVLGAFVMIGTFLNLAYVFNLAPFSTVWPSVNYGFEILIGVVGFAATYLLFRARAGVKKGGVERTILLLVALFAFFFATGGLVMGLVYMLTGRETLRHSALTVENIVPPLAFFFASIAGVAALIILVKNTYAILTRIQRLLTAIISVIVFAMFGLFFFLPVTGIELDGVMKGAACFFSVVCLVAFVGTGFVMMAFGRGRGSSYWRSLTLGLMVTALSGLAVFFLFVVSDKSDGLAILGFSVGMAFLGKAGYERWQILKQ